MRNILIGSPYGQIEGLEYELRVALKDEPYNIIEADSIAALSDYSFVTDSSLEIQFNNLDAVFFRYPYDLIPPFTENFADREKTEFWKSLYLLTSHAALNCPMTSWAMRNRFYSLQQCRNVGLHTPKSETQTKDTEESSNSGIFKALGNCFVTDNSTTDFAIRPYCKHMRDGGDEAFVILAQNGTDDLKAALLNDGGVYFHQTKVTGREYRTYWISGKILHYRRVKPSNPGIEVDKSPWPLEEASGDLPPDLCVPLRKLSEGNELSYFCIDLIDDGEKVTIIDFNPLGSLPDYESCPEATQALAEEIIRKASG